MAVETAEPPVETETPVLPNPVLPSDLDVSKKLFNDAMAAEKAEKSEMPEPEKIEIPKAEPEAKPEPEVTPSEKVKPSKVETSPAAKAKLPEELISGKKPEVKVDDAIAEIDAMVLPKNAKPEQVASFAKLKADSKKIILEKITRINELETKTSDGATRAEIEAAQERVKTAETKAKELESTIERIAFTESPRFKQFLADESSTLTSAKAYFEGTEINPEIIEYAARTTGAQRIKILREAGADAELIAAVSPYLAQYDAIQRSKTGALEHWKTESAQFTEQQKLQQEAQLTHRKAQEDKVWENVALRLKGEVAAFQKFDAHDDWNKRGDDLISEWKRIYNGENVNLDTVAEMIGYGVAYKAEHEIRMAITEELNNALQENAKLKAAKPNGGSTQISSTTTGDDTNLPPMEAAKKRFNAEMAAARGT